MSRSGFSVTAELPIPSGSMPQTEKDQLLQQFGDYQVNLCPSDLGRTNLTFLLPADSLLQATTTARAILGSFSPEPLRLVVEHIADYSRRQKLALLGQIPPLLSVSEAAQLLGITRTAVLKKVTSGGLVATKVGATWVIPAAAIPDPSLSPVH